MVTSHENIPVFIVRSKRVGALRPRNSTPSFTRLLPRHALGTKGVPGGRRGLDCYTTIARSASTFFSPANYLISPKRHLPSDPSLAPTNVLTFTWKVQTTDTPGQHIGSFLVSQADFPSPDVVSGILVILRAHIGLLVRCRFRGRVTATSPYSAGPAGPTSRSPCPCAPYSLS